MMRELQLRLRRRLRHRRLGTTGHAAGNLSHSLCGLHGALSNELEMDKVNGAPKTLAWMAHHVNPVLHPLHTPPPCLPATKDYFSWYR